MAAGKHVSPQVPPPPCAHCSHRPLGARGGHRKPQVTALTESDRPGQKPGLGWEACWDSTSSKILKNSRAGQRLRTSLIAEYEKPQAEGLKAKREHPKKAVSGTSPQLALSTPTPPEAEALLLDGLR